MLSSITNQCHIMVIDDDNEIREVLRILLTGESFEATEAATPSESLHLINRNINLVIWDVMMPEMSGYDLCQQIHESAICPFSF